MSQTGGRCRCLRQLLYVFYGLYFCYHCYRFLMCLLSHTQAVNF